MDPQPAVRRQHASTDLLAQLPTLPPWAASPVPPAAAAAAAAAGPRCGHGPGGRVFRRRCMSATRVACPCGGVLPYRPPPEPLAAACHAHRVWPVCPPPRVWRRSSAIWRSRRAWPCAGALGRTSSSSSCSSRWAPPAAAASLTALPYSLLVLPHMMLLLRGSFCPAGLGCTNPSPW